MLLFSARFAYYNESVQKPVSSKHNRREMALNVTIARILPSRVRWPQEYAKCVIFEILQTIKNIYNFYVMIEKLVMNSGHDFFNNVIELFNYVNDDFPNH